MRKYSFLTFVIFLSCFVIYAQDKDATENTIEKKSFSISEINEREEATIAVINDIKKELRIQSSASEIDLDKQIDSLSNILEQYTEEYIESLSIMSIKNSTSTINGVSKRAKSLQEQNTSIIDQFTLLEAKLAEENDFWREVLEYMQNAEDITKSILERIKKNLSNIKEIKNELSSFVNSELDDISKISILNNEIEEIRDLLERQEEIRRNAYLTKDSEALWKISIIETDTLNHDTRLKQVLSENKKSVQLYFKYNSGHLVFHIIVVVILLLIFRFSQKISTTILNIPSNSRLVVFSENPLLTAYIYSFLIISIGNTHLPSVLLEFYLVTLYYPIFRLLKAYILPENRKFIIGFIVLFSLEILINYVSYSYISGRFLLLIIELITFSYVSYLLYLFRGKSKESNRKLIYNSLSIAWLLYISSIFANIFGVVRLSQLLSEATINSIGIGMLVFIFYEISKALIIVLAEVKPFSKLNIIIDRKEIVLKWLANATRILLIMFFVRAILRQYKLLKPGIESWQNFVNKSWELGEVTISIGDFLNFFLLVFITIFVARFIKHLLGKEILPRFIKKRGLPNAISTSVFYIVLVIGLFLAAFSTGIEWTKVNLAIGALGVGIGFGLQNVVYNFIAGLILTYERPVQVGDIVQIKTLMGSIKEIGVRSSRVLTYDGAEVVVPNGNLISDEVINWTLSNNNKRQELRFKASTNANPKEIVEILKTECLKNPKVISEPKPLSLFEGYGDGTLEFRLLFWTHVDVGLSTKSEVGLAIYEELQKLGYELPIERKIVKIENNAITN